MIVYIDVDDTLVRWAGSKCIPRTLVIDKVKERAANGDQLYLWSRAGGEHARAVAEEPEAWPESPSPINNHYLR